MLIAETGLLFGGIVPLSSSSYADQVYPKAGPLETTPLPVANGNGQKPVIQPPLEHGSDPNVPDGNGNTPLCLAVQAIDLDKVRFLLDHHAEINATDKRGRTPLAIIYTMDSEGWDYDQTKRCNEIEALLGSRGARVFTIVPPAGNIHPSFRITLRGRVLAPRKIDVAANEAITVVQAILKAGGFAFGPDMRRIRVMTRDTDGTSTTTSIDAKKIFDNLSPDLVLKSDATIIIPGYLIN